MKRIAFYSMILLQVVLIAMIGWQHILIDQFGETVKLHVSKENHRQYGQTDDQANIRVKYDINQISGDKWEDDMSKLAYRDRVYVLLGPDDEGYLNVEKASANKLEPTDDQFVFPAKFMHEMNRDIEVEYGIESINQTVHQNMDLNRSLSATVKVAPWGQKKIVELNEEET